MARGAPRSCPASPAPRSRTCPIGSPALVSEVRWRRRLAPRCRSAPLHELGPGRRSPTRAALPARRGDGRARRARGRACLSPRDRGDRDGAARARRRQRGDRRAHRHVRGWIPSRTGVRGRRHRAGETLTGLAAEAAPALARAGVEPSEVDLVLVATLTQDGLLPNAAPWSPSSVGARGAASIDPGSACTGFSAGWRSRPPRSRPAAPAPSWSSAPTPAPRHRPRRPRPPACSATGPGGRAHHRRRAADRSRDPALGRPASSASASHEERADPDARPGHVPGRGHALSESALEASRPRAAARRHRPVRLPPGQRAITRAVGERLGLPTERVVDCIERLGTHRRRACPWRWPRRSATDACGPASACCSAPSAPASSGAAG